MFSNQKYILATIEEISGAYDFSNGTNLIVHFICVKKGKPYNNVHISKNLKLTPKIINRMNMYAGRDDKNNLWKIKIDTFISQTYMSSIERHTLLEIEWVPDKKRKEKLERILNNDNN